MKAAPHAHFLCGLASAGSLCTGTLVKKAEIPAIHSENRAFHADSVAFYCEKLYTKIILI